MRDTVIKHKTVLRIAVIVFWEFFYGRIKVYRHPHRWRELIGLDFNLLGYNEVRAMRERRLSKKMGSLEEYWQKQRLVHFLYGSRSVMEVMVVGIETIPSHLSSMRPDYYWAPGSARYRPVLHKKVYTYESLLYQKECLESQDCFLGWTWKRGHWDLRFLGDWVYIPEKKLRRLWPSFKPSFGVQLPTADWSHEAA